MKMTLTETNANISKKEIIILSQAETIKLDDLVTPEKPLLISPVDYYVFNMVGDDGDEYVRYIVRDADGKLYSTAGKAFGERLIECFAMLTENGVTEPFTMEVAKVPSKNFKGKFYIRGRLVG